MRELILKKAPNEMLTLKFEKCNIHKITLVMLGCDTLSNCGLSSDAFSSSILK